jgi:hypothetical protein
MGIRRTGDVLVPLHARFCRNRALRAALSGRESPSGIINGSRLPDPVSARLSNAYDVTGPIRVLLCYDSTVYVDSTPLS